MSSQTNPPSPSGCGRCGRDERSHAIEWDVDLGEYHRWTEPSMQLRRERMFARHLQRAAGDFK